MAIITARSKDNCKVTIDYSKCINCGLCLHTCAGFVLDNSTGKMKVKEDSVFGCVGCGHCMAICPKQAITVEGRELNGYESVIDTPKLSETADFTKLYNLMLRRRSVRSFLDREIEVEKIQQIIDAAALAPSGIPPTDTQVLVLKTKEKVREFSFDLISVLEKYKWMFSDFFLKVFGIFLGKEGRAAFKTFLNPLVQFVTAEKKQDKNFLVYDAPLAMYFYSSIYADPVDPIIPATYAMIAAESLGIGSCMLGTPAYIIKYGGRKLREKYQIPEKHNPGIMVVFGYPEFRMKKTIKRTFFKVNYL